MNEEQRDAVVYEPPALVEIGDFADLTRITDKGGYIDGLGGWWDP